MKKFVDKYLFSIIGMAVGAVAGYFYWKFARMQYGQLCDYFQPNKQYLLWFDYGRASIINI